MPAAARCEPPGATLPRARRVSYRKPAPRAELSSSKTDLDQTADTTIPPADTLLCSIAVQTEIAKPGIDRGSVMTDVTGQVPRLTGAAAQRTSSPKATTWRTAPHRAPPQECSGCECARAGSVSGRCVTGGELL
ncbi:hypothetical protein [Burkholderia latens]|uniref:hypothetical protein n=1 Tax=Burkholderia latens TaxID=488446 RepID=UPI001FC82F1B|nr:hypothetical protein [Burkholderia latens]